MAPVTELSEITLCEKCDIDVENADPGLFCDGYCRKWFHAGCVDIEDEFYQKIFDLGDKVLWMCQECSDRRSQMSVYGREAENYLNLHELVDKLVNIVKGLSLDNIQIKQRLDTVISSSTRVEGYVMTLKPETSYEHDDLSSAPCTINRKVKDQRIAKTDVANQDRIKKSDELVRLNTIGKQALSKGKEEKEINSSLAVSVSVNESAFLESENEVNPNVPNVNEVVKTDLTLSDNSIINNEGFLSSGETLIVTESDRNLDEVTKTDVTSSKHFTVKDVEFPPLSGLSKVDEGNSETGDWTDVQRRRRRNNVKNINHRPTSVPVENQQKRSTRPSSNQGQARPNLKNWTDKNSFEAKKRQPTKYKTNILTGSASFEGCSLVGSKRAWFHLGKVRRNTTVKDVEDFVGKTFPNISFSVEKLENKGVTDSYRLGVNFEHKDVVMDSTRWPQNVTLKRFLFRRAFKTNQT